MIDAVYSRYSQLKEKPLDPAYSPKNAIRGRLRFNTEDAEKLAVIFPGWHTHKFPAVNLAKRLVKRGWGVIVYDFDDQILLPDDETVVESFRYIRNEITDELNSLLAKKSYSQVHFIGISLGNVPLALVADRFPDFQSATLVVAGDDLAMDLWHGLRTADIRSQFEKMHLGIRKLDADWQDVAPINHVRHFARKKVMFIMSTQDKIIRTKYQRKLAERISEVGGIVEIRKSHFGHMISIIRFCLVGPLP